MKKAVSFIFLLGLALIFWGCEEDKHEKIHKTTIGFATPDLADEYASAIYNTANSESLRQNYNMIITNASGDAAKQKDQLKSMIDLQFDALIVSPRNIEELTENFRSAKQANIPVVLVNAAKTEDAAASVSIDYPAAAIDAASYLKELKQNGVNYSLFYTTGSTNDFTLDVLTTGILGTLDENLYPASLSNGRPRACANESAAQTTARLLINRSAPNNVEAFIAYDEVSAKGITAAIKEAGKTIDDIILIDISGSPVSKQMVKNREMNATVALSPVKLGQTAVNTAIDLINKVSVQEEIVIPTTLVTIENVDEFGVEGWQ